jgi:hypothetical protein
MLVARMKVWTKAGGISVAAMICAGYLDDLYRAFCSPSYLVFRGRLVTSQDSVLVTFNFGRRCTMKTFFN